MKKLLTRTDSSLLCSDGFSLCLSILLCYYCSIISIFSAYKNFFKRELFRRVLFLNDFPIFRYDNNGGKQYLGKSFSVIYNLFYLIFNFVRSLVPAYTIKQSDFCFKTTSRFSDIISLRLSCKLFTVTLLSFCNPISWISVNNNLAFTSYLCRFSPFVSGWQLTNFLSTEHILSKRESFAFLLLMFV